MTTAAIPQWQGARHSTTLMRTEYLSGSGRLEFNVHSRSELRHTIRQRLRVLDVWRYVHYLGRGAGAEYLGQLPGGKYVWG